MTTESTITTPAGGFAGDPFAALNPPTASTGCCASAEATDADNCCATPAASAEDGCCQTSTPAESAGCC